MGFIKEHVSMSWIFIGRTDAVAEATIPWPPDVKNWLIGKDPDAGKDWRQEKITTEDEMVGWHHRLDGHEFEQAPGVDDGQGSLVHHSTQGHKESTWLSYWTAELTFPWTRQRRRFGGDSSTLHSLCILFLWLLHQLHLRSLAIRSQRPGTHEFSDQLPHKISRCCKCPIFTFLRWNFNSQLKRTQVFTWEINHEVSVIHNTIMDHWVVRRSRTHGSQNRFLMEWDCDIHLWS